MTERSNLESLRPAVLLGRHLEELIARRPEVGLTHLNQAPSQDYDLGVEKVDHIREPDAERTSTARCGDSRPR